jgi:hypothetical protein
MEPVAGILLLTIDRWPVICCQRLLSPVVNAIEGFQAAAECSLGREWSVWLNGLPIDRRPVVCCRDYYRQWSTPLRRASGRRCECSPVENGARGWKLPLRLIDRWPVMLARLLPVVNATGRAQADAAECTPG